ncbi:MAG: YggU family protein [Cyanobacteria bacterium SIG32]|nr:YggU family protein [Cyanobacteria bacterium SIG32]
MIKETKDGLIVQFKISPNASKNEIIKTEDGVKIKITAQPIDGKANKALVEYLSKEFKVPKTYIEIVKGTTNKEKTVLFKISEVEKLNFIKEKFN